MEPLRCDTTGKKYRRSIVFAIVVGVQTIFCGIMAYEACDTACESVDYAYQCQKKSQSYCCSANDCQGSCYLNTESCDSLVTISIVLGLLLCVLIVAAVVFKRRMEREREALVNDIDMGQ